MKLGLAILPLAIGVLGVLLGFFTWGAQPAHSLMHALRVEVLHLEPAIVILHQLLQLLIEAIGALVNSLHTAVEI